ncbi:hypothetical protein Taro_043473 [Colocasia esculenta]|uniref:Uncharacterized protein n=1 Tax=Colocasia esculenta TaxID=4460 RepID=A0A843WVW2_COLES|nr:hypothetical protein [Colocasia esculenta]
MEGEEESGRDVPKKTTHQCVVPSDDFCKRLRSPHRCGLAEDWPPCALKTTHQLEGLAES